MKRFILYCLLGILSCVSPAIAQDNSETSNNDIILTEIQQNMLQVDQLIIKKKYDKAMEKAQLALDLALKNFGEEHLTVPACYVLIANVYLNMTDYPKAIEYLQKALPLFMNIPDSENMLSITYHQIANVYTKSGKFDLAEEYSQKAVEVIAELKTDEEKYLKAQMNLASQYQMSLKSKEATEILLEIEPQMLRVYGENSVQMAEFYTSLGETCSMHQPANSRSYFERALTILLENFSNQTNQIAACYEGLGNYYKSIDPNMAVDNFQKALSYYSKDKNKKIRKMPNIYRNLSDIYMEQNKYDLAEDNLNKAIRLLQNAFGDTNAALAPMYQNLAKVYLVQYKEDAVNHCIQKAEQLYKDFAGENNQYVYMLYIDMGWAYVNYFHNVDKGIEYYQKALVEIYNIGGDDHSLVVMIYAMIAHIYMTEGEMNLAVQYADKVLEVYDPQKESPSIYVAIPYAVYAYEAIQKEDWKTVRLNAQKVIDIYIASNSERDATVESMYQLLQLLDENGL